MPLPKNSIALIEEALPMAAAKRLARAEQMGFDTARVWYHGTPEPSNFDEFLSGADELIHFGTRDQANARLEAVGGLRDRVIPVHLNVKNPVRVPDLGSFDPHRLSDYLYRDGVLSGEEFRSVAGLERKTPAMGKLKEILKSKGFDGLIYRNEAEISSQARKALEPLDNELNTLTDEMKKISARIVPDDEAAKAAWQAEISANGDRFREVMARKRAAVQELGSDSVAVFDSNQVRSVNAAFDPKMKKSGNILAGGAAAAVAFAPTQDAEAAPTPLGAVASDVASKFGAPGGDIAAQIHSARPEITPSIVDGMIARSFGHDLPGSRVLNFIRSGRETPAGVQPEIGVDDMLTSIFLPGVAR